MHKRGVLACAGCAGLTLGAAYGGGTSADGALGRAEPIKPARTLLQAHHEPGLVYVKFREGLAIRLRNGDLSDLGSGVLAGARPALSRGAWSRLHALGEAELAALHQTAQRNLGRPLADPNLEYRLMLPPGTDSGAAIDALNALDVVEIAMPESRPAPAPAFPPDFEASQAYLGVATPGVGSNQVWNWPGGTGQGVRLCDVEYSWNTNHADLPAVTLLGPTPVDPFNDKQHGTAVLGQLVGLRNGWGVTGGSYEVQPFIAAVYTAGGGYNVASAITVALGALQPGDVLLIEQQAFGPVNSQYVPCEWNLGVYNAIRIAVGNNIVVVEAAGNGGQNLDGPSYSTGNGGHWPFLPQNDSGAIIVGAGASPLGTNVDRSRMGYSCYGSTVDLQGYGEKVVTTGYGGAFSAMGENYFYTSTFSGTSSASPIVAAACAQMQAIHKAVTGQILTPMQVRDFLRATGSPQQSGTYPLTQAIGPRPNLLPALMASFGNVDCNTNGVPDRVDIAMGTSPDVNGNGIPDECEPCYANCNGDTGPGGLPVLNIADFGCFQTKFAVQDPYADCNADSLFNLADFGCFQTKFAVGCP